MPRIIAGTAVVPPRRKGDCSCDFCGLFRTHHFWLRAFCATAVVPLLLWFTVAVDRYMRHEHAPNNEVAAAVGGLMIVVTASGIFALACWYQPLRRLTHMLHPRQTLGAEGSTRIS